MWGILLSGIWKICAWIFRGVVVKFIILSAIYYVVKWIGEAVLSQLDISSLTGMQSVLDSIPNDILFFLGVFRLDVGIPLILGAMLTAFIIRRLPLVG